MLVLFETPAGYALFKCKEGGELTSNPETIGKHFESAAKAQKLCVRAHACRELSLLLWVGRFWVSQFLKSLVSPLLRLLAPTWSLRHRIKLEAFSQFKDTTEVRTRPLTLWALSQGPNL